ncbi:Pyroglutamyl-peptidase I [Ascochyta rabiei]|uniref:Uncharacterized protein n=1 Tax=Didymella rabiei TaxID=5454 RepID=A0A163CP68_DIDRA|nr:Pyroglutamyl-peptidase I [Ascochyta rabiei]KZM22604.1 hypothetical protein ST47_g6312 [Ascochyta rabiei]UPX19291.1 Pyroglutamyl-peptidase I [Ascochyta rabiei]
MPSASYAARQPPAEKGEKPVHVLVTGFGSFLEKYPKNSSWEIASTLPALIPASPGNPTPIQIRVHHEPIRVAYRTVTDLVPKLFSPEPATGPPPDIVLHIGLAASRNFYAIEQGAHGRGYARAADVDGALFQDAEAADLFPSARFPPQLKTGFDTSDVLARWRAFLGFWNPDGSAEVEELPDVRVNPDAGNFLCGFIYYNSLAHYHELNGGEAGGRPVAFMHVPDLTGSEGKLREGWEVAVALIKALVDSRRKVGLRGGHAGEGAKQEDDVKNNTST